MARSWIDKRVRDPLEIGVRTLAPLLLLIAVVMSGLELPGKLALLQSAGAPLTRVGSHVLSHVSIGLGIVSIVFFVISATLMGGESLWGLPRIKQWEEWLKSKTDPFDGLPGSESVTAVRTPDGSTFRTPFGTPLRNTFSIIAGSAVFFLLGLPSPPVGGSGWVHLAIVMACGLASLGGAAAILVTVELNLVIGNWEGFERIFRTTPDGADVLRLPNAFEMATIMIVGLGFFLGSVVAARREAYFVARIGIVYAIGVPWILTAAVVAAAVRQLVEYQIKHHLPWLVTFLGWLAALVGVVLGVAAYLV